MNTTDELKQLLDAFSASLNRLNDRVKRMEQREHQTAALVRESKTTRRTFRPLDLSGRIGG